MAVSLLSLFNTLLVKCGERGVVVVQRLSGIDVVASWREKGKKKGTVLSFSGGLPSEAVLIRYYNARELDEEVASVTGAGDSWVGAVLAGTVRGLEVSSPEGLDTIVEIAQR